MYKLGHALGANRNTWSHETHNAISQGGCHNHSLHKKYKHNCGVSRAVLCHTSCNKVQNSDYNFIHLLFEDARIISCVDSFPEEKSRVSVGPQRYLEPRMNLLAKPTAIYSNRIHVIEHLETRVYKIHN